MPAATTANPNTRNAYVRVDIGSDARHLAHRRSHVLLLTTTATHSSASIPTATDIPPCLGRVGCALSPSWAHTRAPSSKLGSTHARSSDKLLTSTTTVLVD